MAFTLGKLLDINSHLGVDPVQLIGVVLYLKYGFKIYGDGTME